MPRHFAAHARRAVISGAPQSTGLIREAWLVTRISRDSENCAAVSPIPVRKITPCRPPRGRVLGTILRAALRAHKASKALRRRYAAGALGRRRASPEKSLRRRAARGTVPKGHHLLGAGLEVSPRHRRRPLYPRIYHPPILPNLLKYFNSLMNRSPNASNWNVFQLHNNRENPHKTRDIGHYEILPQNIGNAPYR